MKQKSSSSQMQLAKEVIASYSQIAIEYSCGRLLALCKDYPAPIFVATDSSVLRAKYHLASIIQALCLLSSL